MGDSEPISLRSAEPNCTKYKGGDVFRSPRAADAMSGDSGQTRKWPAVAHRVCHAGKSEGGRRLDHHDWTMYHGRNGYHEPRRYDIDIGYDGDVEPDKETEQQRWRRMLMKDLNQMMFVSGETAEPSPETTGMIEEIVRQQVVEMVSHMVAAYVKFEMHLMKPNHSLLNVPPWQPVVTLALSLPTSCSS